MTPPPAYLFSRAARVAVDEARVAESVREALARAGYRAEVPCRTGAQAFLVLDGGLERVRGLRVGGDEIPVILLSGRHGAAPLAPELGVVERLSVPFTLATLRRAIARVCRFDRECASGPEEGPALPSGRSI